MTIDPSNFEAQGKPTAEQARRVYDSLTHPTCDKLRTELTNRGFKIARATCARWIKSGFTIKSNPGPALNIDKGEVKGVPASVRAVIAAEAAIIGSEMTPQELCDIDKDLTELRQLDMPQLKAMLEQERLMYNIMMLRQAQRKADKLVLIPKDSAAFIVAMTDAAESVPTVPSGLLPGDGAKLIEAHVNPPNPVADAIALFKQRQGVKAA